MMKKLAFITIALVLLAPCLAAAGTAKPFYIGIGGEYAIEDFDIKDAQVQAMGFGKMTFDNTAGLNVFAGYNFTENIALEFDFGYLPDFEWSASSTVFDPGAMVNVPISIEEKVTITTFGLDFKLMLPVGDDFFPYCEFGTGYMDGDIKATATNHRTGATFEIKDSESDWYLKIGLGCEKYFGETFSLRLEGDYNMGINDLDEVRYFTLGLGAGIHF